MCLRKRFPRPSLLFAASSLGFLSNWVRVTKGKDEILRVVHS